MFPQRYSCDRCRQQKSRCLKNWDLSSAVNGSGNQLTPCERCTKADVPCVYSLRQRNRRSKAEDVPQSPRGSRHLSQDLSNVLSSRDVAGYDFNDLMMPSLDTTITCIDDSDAYSWNNSSDLTTYSRDGDNRTHGSSDTSPALSRDECKESLTTQLMRLSNRAMGATRELECAVITMPLTVNSPVVNEAFEAANALVRIINSMPLAESTYGTIQSLSHDESERQLPADGNPIFLALASHQHVLALFRAICDSIKRSMGSMVQGSESLQQTLHGAGSSSAQFIMVLQLIMHLLNRIGRSLRMGHQTNADQYNLTFGAPGGEDSASLQGLVDSARVMLKGLPDEHIKLSKIIQDLQACIED